MSASACPMSLPDEKFAISIRPARSTFVSCNSTLVCGANIGVGHDLSIRELAETVADVVGFKGALEFDASKPDGTPRKLMDVGRLNAMGWQATTGMREGLAVAYRNFLSR